jgi:hypothetical protein
MSPWHPARWPLRTRVALAFLAATGIALTALGVFVQVRVGGVLEDRLRDTVRAEADGLEAMSGTERLEAVEALGGEVHAQVLNSRGHARASSRLVPDPLLPAASIRQYGTTGSGWREDSVTVLDDDDAAAC